MINVPVHPCGGQPAEGSVMKRFSEVVDAADELSVDEQETLIAILRRRVAERQRAALVREAAEARAEHRRGESKPASASDIMAEIRVEP
ncbi:MAG: hypothetical protein WD069_06880 [Planctomycetales bacterium]